MNIGFSNKDIKFLQNVFYKIEKVVLQIVNICIFNMADLKGSIFRIIKLVSIIVYVGDSQFDDLRIYIIAVQKGVIG